MATDDFSASAGPIPGFVIGPACGSVTGPAFDTIAGPGLDFVAGFTPDSVTSFALGIVAGSVTLVIIDLTKVNYFYGKQVMAKNLTNSKLYIKSTIWIEGILFGETGKA